LRWFNKKTSLDFQVWNKNSSVAAAAIAALAGPDANSRARDRAARREQAGCKENHDHAPDLPQQGWRNGIIVMGSQSLSPQQTQARPSSSSMAASPNPLVNGSLVAAASSALQGGGAGGGLGGSRFNSLARQSSIYSLTLDEFQNAMTEPGKNFGSMNMDEFLKNIWTAEESQAMAAAMGSSSIAAADNSQAAGNVDGMSMLLRQPSLQLLQGAMSLPRTLSRKTVDQVWKDIHRDSSSGGSDSGGGVPLGPTTTSAQERQTTFGEMTLEDFLMKAGVVREDAADIGTSQQQQGFSSFMGSSGLHPHGERSDRINVQSGDPGDRISGASGGGDIVPTLSLSPANVMPSQASIDAMQMDAYNKNQAATAASQQQQQVHSDLILQFSH
jgi:hypothetical protein